MIKLKGGILSFRNHTINIDTMVDWDIEQEFKMASLMVAFPVYSLSQFDKPSRSVVQNSTNYKARQVECCYNWINPII